jgi:hypothetical protein
VNISTRSSTSGSEQGSTHVDRANADAVARINSGDPVLIDVRPAREVVPGLTANTVMTSGALLPWAEYTGGQRDAVIGGALFEGMARDAEHADALLRSGEIVLAGCQDHDTIGSLAGVTTSSMPVLVVEDATDGNRAYCTLFEGAAPARLNYGVYNEAVRESLQFLERVIAPVLGEAVRRTGGIHLNPIIRRALHMGDELHSRNAAGTLLFTRDLLPHLVALSAEHHPGVEDLAAYLGDGDYFFLRASMAASKATLDRLTSVEGSTVVRAMAFSCKEFAIRVAGMGDEWFRGPLPTMEAGGFFDGYSVADIELMGGESPITESMGLGGFAQAAAFPLQSYQGGTSERMVQTNLEMYEIALAESPNFRIPYFAYRGVPTGIDIRRVVETGITPAMDIGIAGRGGGQIGAGSFRAPLGCFESALAEHERRYGAAGSAA